MRIYICIMEGTYLASPLNKADYRRNKMGTRMLREMIVLQEQEKTTAGEGNPALSLWIHEHDTHILTFDNSNERAAPEQEESALAAYEQAIELAPREATLHYHKGQILEQLGRLAEAESAYEEARSLGHNGLREDDLVKTLNVL